MVGKHRRLAMTLALMVWAPMVVADPLLPASEPASVTIAITVNVRPLVSSVEEALQSTIGSGGQTLGSACIQLLDGATLRESGTSFRVDASHYYHCSAEPVQNSVSSGATTMVLIAST